ncbi:MAG: hypothetical protein AAFP86_20365, partial [Planctomycetota bacterium]
MFFLSGATWIYIEPGSLASGWTGAPIIACADTNAGWMLRLQRFDYLNLGVPVTRFEPVFQLFPATDGMTLRPLGSSGPGTVPIGGSFSAADEGKWFHIGFNYNRNTERAQIFLNGAVIATAQGRPIFAGGLDADFRIFTDLTWHRGTLGIGHAPDIGTLTQRFRGRIDGTRIWDVQLSPPSFAAEYAQGDPTIQAVLTPKAQFEYDSTAPLDNAANDQPWWRDLILGTGATSGVETGIVLDAGRGDAKRGRYRVELVRTNPTANLPRVNDDVTLLDVQSVVDAGIGYPTMAYQALRVRASGQLNGATPEISNIVQGRLVPVWDGASLTDPNTIATFTANPAWVILDIATNRRVGMGTDFRPSSVDLERLQEFA